MRNFEVHGKMARQLHRKKRKKIKEVQKKTKKTYNIGAIKKRNQDMEIKFGLTP